ncbi:hypothetical protein [Paraflavitalea sp. CAU 1676]|uniref:hypothetical protein n=1 Tax=Paraflavitalea sp. CAU 1676 TaxID=3032598 RepID=UPI0023DC735C|nr:hypothetical protein [Paraflavitalea sp. CAU 1676]MDF2189274.1 hypothetical protein [Paraflavitalea sp. CAU 1676]
MQRTMDHNNATLLETAVGFGVGITVWFLRLPDPWVLGEFLKALEALLLGGIGAIGAWFVRRHILRHVEQHGSVKAWLKHILKPQKSVHDERDRKPDEPA